MSTRRLVVLSTMVLLAGIACQASAAISLNYLGAFNTGLNSVYNGGLALYPGGNGGAGSLFVSADSSTDLTEVSIPAPVKTSDVTQLNTAATINTIASGKQPNSLVYNPTDNKLYFSQKNSSQITIASINVDGTGAITSVAGPANNAAGCGSSILPQAWADAHADGREMLLLGSSTYGPRLSSVDPEAPSTVSKLIYYKSGHEMNGYGSIASIDSVASVEANGELTIIVAGADSNNGATLWFFNADDIANAAIPYDVQPYATLAVQDDLFVGNTLSGLTYDTANNVLYGYEGQWDQPTVVHAWAVAVPEPVTLVLLAMGGALGLGVRRRRA